MKDNHFRIIKEYLKTQLILLERHFASDNKLCDFFAHGDILRMKKRHDMQRYEIKEEHLLFSFKCVLKIAQSRN